MSSSSYVVNEDVATAQIADIAELFALLGDPHRLRLLTSLRDAPTGELCVSDLALAVVSSESAVSHALRLLRAHQVVTVRRSGRHAYYSLADAHVRQLLDVALAHADHSSTPPVTVQS